LPPESLVTHRKVPTRQLRHKRSCYVLPGRRQLNWGDDARPGRPRPWLTGRALTATEAVVAGIGAARYDPAARCDGEESGPAFPRKRLS
jgi:hypothetical protein